MLSFHVVDYIGGDLEQFEYMEVLHAAQFQRYNVHINRVYRKTLLQRRLCTVETFGVIDTRREEGLTRTDGMRIGEQSSNAGRIIHIEPTGCYIIQYRKRNTVLIPPNALNGLAVVGGAGQLRLDYRIYFKSMSWEAFMVYEER